MRVVIKTRRDTEANWTSINPILELGEMGIETDTRKIKFGDGSTLWNDLQYINAGSAGEVVAEDIDDRISELLVAGSGISLNYNDGGNSLTISTSGVSGIGISNIVEDTTPQLGGNLDANSFSIDMGDNSITDAKVGQWDTAYGWGDHSVAGYITTTYDAAVPWTANHTLVDGTRYLANDIVYESGNLYKANFDNESLPVSNTEYWTNLGPGYRLNIDGRDISNIPYPITKVNGYTGDVTIATTDLADFNTAVSGLLPVKNIVAGTGIGVTPVDGTFTIETTLTSVSEASKLVTTVFNKTGSQIPKFSVVYIDGGQGDMPTITKAIASGESGSSKTYGITAENIDHMSTGKVIVAGALTGLNTDQFNPTSPSGDVNGVSLYLSPSVAGGVTTTKPSAPDHMVYVGTIVRTHQNEGVVEVKIQNGYEIQELHNVAISGVANNDILVYNSGTQLWANNHNAIFSNITGITGASKISNIVVISQEDYDALSSYDANTVYLISSASYY